MSECVGHYEVVTWLRINLDRVNRGGRHSQSPEVDPTINMVLVLSIEDTLTQLIQKHLSANTHTSQPYNFYLSASSSRLFKHVTVNMHFTNTLILAFAALAAAATFDVSPRTPTLGLLEVIYVLRFASPIYLKREFEHLKVTTLSPALFPDLLFPVRFVPRLLH